MMTVATRPARMLANAKEELLSRWLRRLVLAGGHPAGNAQLNSGALGLDQWARHPRDL